MPPTDIMTILSRADHIIHGFIVFLKLQGIISEGEENVLLNPLPFTALVPMVDNISEKIEFNHCFATSVCTTDSVDRISISDEISYNNIKILSTAKLMYTTKNGLLYIYSLNNAVMELIFRAKINNVKYLDKNFRSRSMSIRDIKKYSQIYAISFLSSENILSIASIEPFVLELNGKNIARLYMPRSNIVLVSDNKTYIQLLREIYIYKNIAKTKGSIKRVTSLVEVLDPITFATSMSFDKSCIDVYLLNSENLSYNAIVKVYGYIDEIIVDDMIRFKPRYSIIRLALPEYGATRVKLCISTYIPGRSKIVSLFQNSSQFLNSS